MKRLLLLLMVCLALSAGAQRKIGLIIAIGNYPEGGKWRNLSSLNDIAYIRNALIQNGFAPNNIDTLIDKRATKKGMEDALDDLARRAEPGDIVVFHFSGHGQQIFDDNGDELDGYDEALIPYDAGAYYDPVNYRGEKHFRDDELGKKLNAIRAKIGAKGTLVVILDACHSGTATRSAEVFQARGVPVPFMTPGYKVKAKVDFSNGSGEESFLGGGTQLGSTVVFSASSPNQVNFETKDADGKGVGSLTYAVARALTDLKPGSSYAYLFERIRSQIQAKIPQQIPMAEGNMNQEVFGGDFIVPVSFISVQKWVNDSTFYINGGFFQQINKGSTFKVYALNDKEEKMPLAEGYISLAGSFQSVGIINKAIIKGEAYKIKLNEENYGEFAASLMFKVAANKGTSTSASRSLEQRSGVLINQLKNFIKPYEFLTLSDAPDFLFQVKDSTGGTTAIEMIDKQDSTRWFTFVKAGDTLSAEVLKDMFSTLKRAMRVGYLRNMPDGGMMAQNIIIEVIPATGAATGDITLKPGDEFSIRIKNNNAYPVYFNLVDLMPDNEVKVLIPYEGRTAQEAIVQAGEEFVIDGATVDDPTPTGREFMKFIFTREPVDLRPVFARSTTRGPASKTGLEGVMDDMFKDSNDKMATRAAIRNIKIDEIGVITRSYNVRQKK